MTNPEQLWLDPRKTLWGFHCHQELSLDQFSDALVVNEHCAKYLQTNGMEITNNWFRPGYGPHVAWMWEIRVERGDYDALEQMGLAASFLAINRCSLSAFIHPLMHDPKKDEDLETEGLMNQANILWFGNQVEQNQDFFFNPPRDENNQIADTRNPQMLTKQEHDEIQSRGSALSFLEPANVITIGYHVHVDYEEHQHELAMAVFEKFLQYLSSQDLAPTSTRIYAPGENGPHERAGWEAKFAGQGTGALRSIGIVIGWLMCNRQGLSVFFHPETWQEGDLAQELEAHERYASFIGEPPRLNLSFFRDKIRQLQITQLRQSKSRES